MKFYTFKQIYLTLGISATELYNRIKSGKYPPTVRPNPHKKRLVGYYEETLHNLPKYE